MSLNAQWLKQTLFLLLLLLSAVIAVVVVLLSVQSAGRSTPVGPALQLQLALRTSTSGTEDGCSGSAVGRRNRRSTAVRQLNACMIK